VSRVSRSIAFVIEHAYVDALACFREPIKWFAARGDQVDVYLRMTATHPVPNFLDPRIRLIPLEVSVGGAARLVQQLVTRRPRYAMIFTVPQWSLRWAMAAARVTGIPVAYISDELIVDEGPSKTRERRAHQRCAFTIALSPERAAYVRALNGLPESHPIFVVPNAGPGPAERLPSRFYQDTLGLAPDRPVVLHAGGMGWAPAEALATEAATWRDDGPAIVFQGRLPAQIRGRTDRGAVRYSPTVLPSALLDYAVSSAHIGLALYDDKKVNDRLMSTASGKLCLYMKNALPVITTRQDCFDWVERDGCGVRIASMRELPAAVQTILDDYERYACNVRTVYDARLDFVKNFAAVDAAMP
jgi:hypothetical protein